MNRHRVRPDKMDKEDEKADVEEEEDLATNSNETFTSS
jgi:hypothetical protein